MQLFLYSNIQIGKPTAKVFVEILKKLSKEEKPYLPDMKKVYYKFIIIKAVLWIDEQISETE